MQLEMFVVPIKNVSEAEAEMNGFLRGHRVLAVKKEFVADGENSFWSFCVEYLDGAAVATTGGTASSSRPPKVDYREILTPEEFELFSRLRDWRKAAAEKEGVPSSALQPHTVASAHPSSAHPSSSGGTTSASSALQPLTAASSAFPRSERVYPAIMPLAAISPGDQSWRKASR